MSRALQQRILEFIAEAGGTTTGAELREQLQAEEVSDNARKSAMKMLLASGQIEFSGSTTSITYSLSGAEPRGQRAAGSGQRAAGSGQRAAGSGQRAAEKAATATAPKQGRGVNGSAKARHPGHSDDLIVKAENAERVLKALEFSANVAQDALDVYLQSVADPGIAGPLFKARDESRAALQAFVGRGQ